MPGNTKTPYVIAIIILLIYTSSYIVTKAALNHGMNSFVFSFYRQAAASLFLLPIALIFQRKDLLSLSPGLLLKLFICALIGNTACINLANMSLTLTSVTVASAATNSIPVFTFCFALIFRMEVLKLRTTSGITKLAGIVLCVAGVFVLAFYAGPALSPVNHHHAFTHTSTPSNSPSRAAWIKGTFLVLLSSVAWSLWLVMQTALLNEYPNKMLMTVMQCVFSVVQCFFVAVVAERDFCKWMLRLDFNLLAVIYSGIMVTGVVYYLQVWCMESKGPVFLAIFTPLLFVFTMFCSSFFLGEIVHLGSIIGGVLLVGGLYSVLWGKSKEPQITTTCKVNSSNGIEDQNGQHHKAQAKVEAASASAAQQV